MGTLSLRLPDDLAHRLQTLTESTGRSKTDYVLQALREYLDELEDIRLAEQRLLDVRAGRSATHTLDEVERSLGLAD